MKHFNWIKIVICLFFIAAVSNILLTRSNKELDKEMLREYNSFMARQMKNSKSLPSILKKVIPSLKNENYALTWQILNKLNPDEQTKAIYQIVDAKHNAVICDASYEYIVRKFIFYLLDHDGFGLIKDVDQLEDAMPFVVDCMARWERANRLNTWRKNYKKINKLLHALAKEGKCFIETAGYRRNGVSDMFSLVKDKSFSVTVRCLALEQIVSYGDTTLLDKLKEVYDNEESTSWNSIKIDLKMAIDIISKKGF